MPKKDQDQEMEFSWLHEDFDANVFVGERKRRTRSRKTDQHCSQAQHALAWVIETDLRDDRLEGLSLAEVRPNPDSSHLLLVVMAPPGADLRATHQGLIRAQGHLREVLARELSRKRVPELSSLVLPQGDQHDE